MGEILKNTYYYNKKVKIIKDFIKKIYSIIFKMLFIFKRKKYNFTKINKILFISLFFRGDLLYHTPLINIIKNLYPDSLIDVWVKSRTVDILNNNPFINEVIVFDDIKTAEYNEVTKFNLKAKFSLLKKIRSKKYDLIVDYTGLYSTALFVLFSKAKNSFGRNLQEFGFCYTRYDDTNTFIIPGHLIQKNFNILKKGLEISDKAWEKVTENIPTKPQIFISKEIKQLVGNELEKRDYNKNQKIVTLHLGSGWDAKRWSINNFEILINKLINNYQIAVVGDGSDKIHFDEIKAKIKLKNGYDKENIFFSLNIMATAEIIRRSALFIGSDSGPLHLAYAVDTPSIAMFGPTNPEFSKPIGAIHKVLYNKLDCSAAENEQYCSRNAGKSCPDIVCMKMITVEDVYEKVKFLLNA
ncbi:MAG: glycosyltransferase family 9 protein [Ignavibacteriae bacterium]|nr:glycosyltransferase family 9 protein [Ignavibacteriota bacterium]